MISARHRRAGQTVVELADRYATLFESEAIRTAIYWAILDDDFLRDMADLKYRLQEVLFQSVDIESDLAPRLRRAFWGMNSSDSGEQADILRERADEIVGRTLFELAQLIEDRDESYWDSEVVASTLKEIEEALENPRWSR